MKKRFLSFAKYAVFLGLGIFLVWWSFKQIPDDKWGEAVKGFVVIKEGVDLKEADIISYARTQIAGYKCPKSINYVSELPRNPSGKILRREIRDPFWEGKERKVSGN